MPPSGDITLSCVPTAPPTLRPSQTGAALHIAILAICGTALIAAFVFTPGQDGLSLLGFRWPMRCWLHETFGLRCSLCGMSRSFCSLAHGDLPAAFTFHRLGPALFVLFCLEVPYRLYALAAGLRAIPGPLRRVHTTLAWTACAALVVNWLRYLGGLVL